jgi:hypothetical protein
MKLTLIAFAALLAQQTFAQDTAGHCLTFSISGGAFLPRHPGGQVVESFPYTATSATTGIISNQQFNGSLGGDFPVMAVVESMVNLEFERKQYAINAGSGLLHTRSTLDDGYLHAGYARVLRFHRSRFRLQPGIDLCVVLGSQIELGRIDNLGETLQLLGHTAGPQWTVSYTDRRGEYHSTTYTAHYLDVYYRRDALLLRPNLAFTATFGRLAFGLRAGWMFQLSQGCLLLLQQEDNSNDLNTIARIHQPRNGSLDGLYTVMTIGLIERSRHRVANQGCLRARNRSSCLQ